MNKLIQQEIREVDWNNKDSIISFYEKNTVYFENINVVYDLELLVEIVDIKLSYIFALDSKEHYTKADKCIENCKDLIEKLRDTESYKRINERFLFASGIISQRLNRLDESQVNFEKLVKIDSENDLYKKWYESNKDQLIYRQSRFIGYMGFAIFLVCLFNELLLKINEDFKLKLELFGVMMMIFGFYGYKLRKLLMKFKNGL